MTISNNTATAGANARGGGIEDGANSPLTINNCTITGNTSDIGGGVATTNAFINQLTTITNCTISGNSASLGGGALFIVSGLLTANLNRIVSNTAPTGSGIWQTGGTASVENNWWGCDGFPNAAGCQTGSGTFDADPRIDLRLLPASATLAPGGTQSFTANVSQNTNGAAINPVVLNGLTITFSRRRVGERFARIGGAEQPDGRDLVHRQFDLSDSEHGQCIGDAGQRDANLVNDGAGGAVDLGLSGQPDGQH